MRVLQQLSSSISRRRFLKGSSAIALASLFGVRGNVAYAEPVTATLAVVGLALNVAKLLGSGGPSITDLLQKQTELLLNISTQLGVVQQGIGVIIQRLDEISVDIAEIPAGTVQELYRQNISGIVQLNGELMEIYALTKERSGIQQAQEVVGERLEQEVLRPVRLARQVIMNNPTYINVPMVCVAMVTEVSAMIMANYPDEAITVPLDRYERYLSQHLNLEVSGSLAYLAVQSSNKRLELKNQVESLSVDLPACHYPVYTVASGQFFVYASDIHKYLSSFELNYSITTGIDERVLSAAREMQGEGYLLDTEFPAFLDHDLTDELIEQVNHTTDVERPTGKYYGVPACPPSSVDSANTLWNTHLQETLRLMTFRSLEASAGEALKRCKGFKSELS